MALAGTRSQDVYAQQGFGKSLNIKPPAALLIVDYINGFADPALFGGGNIDAAIKQTVKLLALAREWRWPVSFTRVVYADDGSDANVLTDKVPGLLSFTEQSAASRIVPELAPLPGELIVCKQFPSAFFGTTLASWFANRGVKTVVVAGATTSGCVRASVLDAMCCGFRPVLVEDCTGDRSIPQHESNIFDMKMKYAEVMALEKLEKLSALKANP